MSPQLARPPRGDSRSGLLRVGILAGALAFHHIALTADWVRKDASPPAWDDAVHLGTALDYKEAWREGRWLDLLRTSPRPGHPPYPPLYAWSLTPVLSDAAPQRAAAWVNLFYAFVLMGSAAWAAWLIGGTGAAALALAAVGLSPELARQSRHALPDMPLAAWTALAYAFILASRRFEDRRLSVAAGLAAALALNTKWSAFSYLLPAAAFGLREPLRRRNLAIAAGVAAALCLPWYLLNAHQMVPRLFTSARLGQGEGDPMAWTWAGWAFYAKVLASWYSWAGVGLFFAGSLHALHRRLKGTGAAAAWLLVSYVFWTFVPNKNDRYLLPAAAALPVLGASALPAPLLAAGGAAALWNGRGYPRPDPGDWKHDLILTEIERLREPSRPAAVCALANARDLNPTALSWEARHRGLTGISFGCHESEVPEWADFVLLKTGDPGLFLAEGTRRIITSALEGKEPFVSLFEEAKRWPLPDGSEAVLYKLKADLPLLTEPRRWDALQVRSARLEDVRLTPAGPGRYVVEVGTVVPGKLPAPVRGVRVLLEDARIAEVQGRLYVLGVSTARIASASVGWQDLSRALTARSGLLVQVGDRDGAVFVRLGAGLSSAAFDASSEDGHLKIGVRRARLLGLPLPRFSRDEPLRAAPPHRPYALIPGPIRVRPEGLRIGQ